MGAPLTKMWSMLVLYRDASRDDYRRRYIVPIVARVSRSAALLVQWDMHKYSTLLPCNTDGWDVPVSSCRALASHASTPQLPARRLDDRVRWMYSCPPRTRVITPVVDFDVIVLATVCCRHTYVLSRRMSIRPNLPCLPCCVSMVPIQSGMVTPFTPAACSDPYPEGRF